MRSCCRRLASIVYTGEWRARNYSSATRGCQRLIEIGPGAGATRRITPLRGPDRGVYDARFAARRPCRKPTRSACTRSAAHARSAVSATAEITSTDAPSRLRPWRVRSPSAYHAGCTSSSVPLRLRTWFSRYSSVVRQPARSRSRRSPCSSTTPCRRRPSSDRRSPRRSPGRLVGRPPLSPRCRIRRTMCRSCAIDPVDRQSPHRVISMWIHARDRWTRCGRAVDVGL